MKFKTIEQAKARLDKDIEEAHKRYEQRVRDILEQDKPRARPTKRADALDEAAKRHEKAFSLRQNGMTLADIAQRFDVSTERARQLVRAGERGRKAKLKTLDLVKKYPYSFDLSTRATNAISAITKTARDEDLDPKEVAAKVTSLDLISQPNVGDVTVREIREWLVGYGFELRGG